MTIKIFSPPHVSFAARILEVYLTDMGHEVTRTNRIDSKDSCLYIIYSSTIKTIHPPKNYIVYNTEVPSSDWFTQKYLNEISGAKAVWDYSIYNTERYKHLNKNISIVTPGVSKQPAQSKDIPIMFYGWTEGSTNRKLALKEIATKYKILTITDRLEHDIWELLHRAKVIVNIHYYDKPPLETFRINEALSFGCHVISERSSEGDERYNNYIQFADTHKDFARLLRSAMTSDFDYDLSPLDNYEEIKKAISLI